MAIEIRHVRSPEDDPTGFEVLVAATRADRAVREPDDPIPSPGAVASNEFGLPADRTRLVYAARLSGEPAGMATATTMSGASDENQVAEVEILVIPAHRGKGVATALMAEIIPALVELGQTSVLGYVASDLWTVEGVGFCERYGMEQRQVERCSRAKVADIDDELMTTWVTDAAVRAPGYRLEQWEGSCPDHLIDAWCAALAGMQDAPLDDVEYSFQTRSAEQQREADRSRQARGYRVYCSLVLSPEGDAAGMSAITLLAEQPQVAHQGDTAVLAAHRGRGLGRWLKAANYQLVRRSQPEVAVIETYNAESNPWMLDINIAMGFRPFHGYLAFQAPIETVAAARAPA